MNDQHRDRFLFRGMYKVCPICGKTFWVEHLDEWVYKRCTKRSGKQDYAYFNKYSCMLEFDRQKEASQKDKPKKPKNTKSKRTISRKDPLLPNPWADMHCVDCRYCMEQKYGFQDCSIYQMPINKNRNACRRFRPKDQYDW